MISLSIPQARMLRRVLSGEVLPTTRFRSETATMRALERKGLVQTFASILDDDDRWIPTDLAKKVDWKRGVVS